MTALGIAFLILRILTMVAVIVTAALMTWDWLESRKESRACGY